MDRVSERKEEETKNERQLTTRKLKFSSIKSFFLSKRSWVNRITS